LLFGGLLTKSRRFFIINARREESVDINYIFEEAPLGLVLGIGFGGGLLLRLCADLQLIATLSCGLLLHLRLDQSQLGLLQFTSM